MQTLLATLILFPALLGATPAQSSKAQDKTPTPCRVSGRVVSAVDGAPLKSSRVALIQEDAKDRPQVFATSTDIDGHFEIKDVIAGRYTFFAMHVGFVDQQYQAKSTGEGAVLALQPGQEITDVQFRMIRAGVITGRILDENGEPLAKVMVSAMRNPTSEEMEDDGGRPSRREHLIAACESITDDRGEYRLYGLKPGEYYVKASESAGYNSSYYFGPARDYQLQHELGSEYAPLYYPGVLNAGQALAVAVAGGDEIQADFNMRRVLSVEVAGKVIGPDGKAPSSCYVRIESSGSRESGSTDFDSGVDSKGEFSIKNVPPGSYTIVASEYDQGKLWHARQKIEVGERKVNSLVLALGAGNKIVGHVAFTGRGKSPNPDHVFLWLEPIDDSNDIGGSTRSEKDGSFEILDVPDGSYAVHARLRDSGWYVKSARFGPDDALEKGVQIEAGGTDAKLDIVMSSASAELEGSVMHDDKPALGVHVRVHADPETPYNELRASGAMTDQNGHFSIPNLAPGRYRVTAKLSVDSGVPLASAEAQTITLHEGDRQLLQLTLVEPKDQ